MILIEKKTTYPHKIIMCSISNEILNENRNSCFVHENIVPSILNKGSLVLGGAILLLINQYPHHISNTIRH